MGIWATKKIARKTFTFGIYMYMLLYICIYVCRSVYVFIFMYACMCACMYACVCACACVSETVAHGHLGYQKKACNQISFSQNAKESCISKGRHIFKIQSTPLCGESSTLDPNFMKRVECSLKMNSLILDTR